MTDYQTITKRWKSRRYIADAKPVQVVKVRSVEMSRAYRHFEFLSGRRRERMGRIVGGNNENPWQGYLNPTGRHPDWITVPNVAEVQIDGELSQGADKGGSSSGSGGSGVTQATVKIENVVFKRLTGALGIYHAVVRGYLSPFLGFYANTGAPIREAMKLNEWFNMLGGGYQIKIWQGYGDEITPVFTGIIDDADLDSDPDFITVTARDFGARYLQDQFVFGWNKARECRSPITFADRKEVEKKKLVANELNAAKKNHWILVDDASDVVKWVLTWAGFHEWYVEDFGTTLKQPITFHQSDSLWDIIQYICAQGNFVFYMDAPTEHDLSIGSPVFRESHALMTPEPAMQFLTENDLLEGVQIKYAGDPLAFIIRARGAPTRKAAGSMIEGDDATKRFHAHYFPPWSGQRRINPDSVVVDSHSPGRLAKTHKQVVHIEVLLNDDAQCLLMAVMIAYQEALASTSATFTCPGYPPAHRSLYEDAGSLGFHLDGQVKISDSGSGTVSRVWIRKLTTQFTEGEQAKWTSTVEGALLDTPDMFKLNRDYDYAMKKAGRTRHHPPRPIAVNRPGGFPNREGNWPADSENWPADSQVPAIVDGNLAGEPF